MSTKAYREANKEKINTRNKAYREANKENIAAQQKEYKQANVEKIQAYREANKEKAAKQSKLRHGANRGKVSAQKKAYRAANKERRAAYNYAYNEANPETRRAIKAKRRAAKLQATPPWYNHTDCVAIYKELKPGYNVDHIIPLQGENVSGLHWHHNLQLLPAAENMSKSNKFDPDTYTHELPFY